MDRIRWRSRGQKFAIQLHLSETSANRHEILSNKVKQRPIEIGGHLSRGQAATRYIE